MDEDALAGVRPGSGSYDDPFGKLPVTDDPARKFPVTVDVRGVSLYSAVRIALRLASAELGCEIAGDGLLVTDSGSIGNDTENFVGRVYPLAPLLSAQDPIDVNCLASLIGSSVAPGTSASLRRERRNRGVARRPGRGSHPRRSPSDRTTAGPVAAPGRFSGRSPSRRSPRRDGAGQRSGPGGAGAADHDRTGRRAPEGRLLATFGDREGPGAFRCGGHCQTIPALRVPMGGVAKTLAI